MQEIDITWQNAPGALYVVNGAPPIIEFERLMLWAPNPPEVDIVLSATGLSDWAAQYWGEIQ
jgi:hypothetical protein